ncbi:mechanosensitive ion channel family protein [Spongiibacter sp. KMU-158]|uniref:Small-conductance mechanosensitive channel n=1 Tax=Spongiibacter pelagi TaxID=2760804 RepID=A0A927GVB5_9GAMM|nr:mechanosensitive ion channel domain-containing protein [Spongiibacter pelagi]MBD2857702.1 mechanosensitive ion channel family protein [Spongiibacter pelagi]
MNDLQAMIIPWLISWIPSLFVLVLLWLAWVFTRKVFDVQKEHGADTRYREQGTRLLFRLAGLVLLVATLPISNELRGQLFSLIGLLASAAIALSSTSLMGNLMAGFMLRTVNSFKAGDYIEFRGELGRVSQRGLLHVEIQNETSELVTVPNLLLVQEPYNVVRSSGTVVSADVSLGYDVDRRDIEAALLKAIEDTELENGFVQIRELGDFSVTYRASGLLKEAGLLLSTRSKLRGRMLDALHNAGIEIVSPNFMNQRVLNSENKIIPVRRRHRPEKDKAGQAEEILFSKAELGSVIEKLQGKIKSLKDDLANEEYGEKDREAVKEELSAVTAELEIAREAVKAAESQDKASEAEEKS